MKRLPDNLSQTILLALTLTVLLLSCCQGPEDVSRRETVWHPQVEDTVLCMLRELQPTRLCFSQKLKPVAIPFIQNLNGDAVMFDGIAYSNTSFMAGLHCVCVPLRL